MRELGDEATALRRKFELKWSRSPADCLSACGEHAEDVVAGPRAAGMPGEQTIACRDPLDAVPHVRRSLGSGDVLLVKGSRAVALERVVAALQSPARMAA